MRHIVDFRNISDTGEIDADAIVPYNDGESANQTTLRRPVENLRTRTEELRTRVREHILMRDIDRNGPALFGGGTITFNGTVGGGGNGKFTTTASLFILPMVTPGDGVETTPPYVASSSASLTIGTFGNNQVIIESVRKQFEGDGVGNADLAKADANRLSVEILNDTAESIALEGSTGDVNNIKITIIDGTTTAQELIDLINGDVTVSAYVTATLEPTSVGTNAAPLWGPDEWAGDYSLRFLQGGFPGIVHEIPFGAINDFFTPAENVLKAGDTLAVWYAQILDDTELGGVLQSTSENGNTVLSSASLFNTRRNPEKCANAIPLCKCIDSDTLVFIDGSYIKKDIPATLYFDSGSRENSALLGIIDTTGWTRMHQAPGAHTPPTTIQEALNNADDLFENVMAEINAARDSSVYGPQASLDARMEAADVEINNARTSSIYGAKASLNLRIEEADQEIDAARTSTVYGTTEASLSERIDLPEQELEFARTSPVYGGPQPTLKARIDLADQEIYDARTSSVYLGPKASLKARIDLVDEEVQFARTSPWEGAFPTLSGRIDWIDGEVLSARNSSVYGAQANLDARIEQADQEIDAARTSTVYGAQASLNARIEEGDQEIDAARTSTVFGAKSALVDRLEAVDTHAATVVTVGPTGSGRMYTGDSGLYNALVAVNGTPALIVVDPNNGGYYTLDGNLTITAPIQIIGKGGPNTSNYAGFNLQDYKLQFGSGGWDTNGSGICNMNIIASASGELTFTAPRGFIRDSYLTCQLTVTSSGTWFQMTNCRCLDGFRFSDVVSTRANVVRNCYIYSNTAVETNIIFSSASQFINCEIEVAQSNTLSFGMGALINCQITAPLNASTTNYLISLTRGFIRGLTVTKTGSDPAVQRVLRMTSCTACDVEIDMGADEVRYLTGAGGIITMNGWNDDIAATLTRFRVVNFKLPFDANKLSLAEPLINLAPNAYNKPVTARDGFIGGLSHNVATGDMDAALIGSDNTVSGWVTLDNIVVDTTGITYTSGTRSAFFVGSNSGTVKNCKIVGTGNFRRAIFMSGDKIHILNNSVDVSGTWSNLIEANTNNWASCRGNILVHNGPSTVSGIRMGSSPTYVDCSHNEVFAISPGGAAAISLSYVDRGIVIGNLISANYSTKIDYVACTNMVPPIANIGDYNMIA